MFAKIVHVHLLARRSGQSLMEMALFLMMLLFLLAGAVNFGIAYFSYVAIRDAAQEGVLYGSIHPPYSTVERVAIENRIKNSSASPVDLWGGDVNVTVATPDGTEAGHAINVIVRYDYPVLLPFINLLIETNPGCGSCIPLKAKATGVILVSPPAP